MIAVDLGDAAQFDPACEEFARVGDGEAQVLESALVAAPRGVADDYRKDIDAYMIVRPPPHGAVQKETSISAAEVEDDRRASAKELFPVQPPLFGQSLEGCLGPL